MDRTDPLDRLREAIKNDKPYSSILIELASGEYAAFFLGIEAVRARLSAPLAELREKTEAAVEAISQEYD